MKKIGIAIFALMFAGVSYAGAQEVEIDFDGESDIQDIKKSKGFSMPEVFADSEYAVAAPKREVKYGDLTAYNKSKIKVKSVSTLIRGLNPYQKIKFLESMIFNSTGELASFYGKDIQDILGKDRLETAKNTIFGLKSKKEDKSQNDLKKSFKGFNDTDDEDDTCGGVPNARCWGNGSCKAALGYWCSPCACK